MTPPHERYRAFLETLSLDTLDRLSDHVTPDVRFKDPFNDVRGADAMARIFRHMFASVDNIRFTVDHSMASGDTSLMSWRFQGMLSGRQWSFEGSSVLRFAPDGRVAEHVDHWDAAGQFYERFPVIGWLLAALRRRLAVR
jgi:steroid delta-isomerase